MKKSPFATPENTFQSRVGSPRKHYRWFRGKTHAILNEWFVPKAEICPRFAVIPMIVDGKWLWLKPYFSLRTIKSAFSFGGTTTVRYHVSARSKSIFGLKSKLKEESAILNLYRKKQDWDSAFAKWPENFKKAFSNALSN